MPEFDEKKERDDVKTASLTKLNILETIIEESFNNLASLTSYICNAPIALVQLKDKNKLYLKSKIELTANLISEILNLCDQTARQLNPLIITDTYQDQQFANKSEKELPIIRFYLGIPLQMHNRNIVGTLSVIDVLPRQMTTEQIEVIQNVSHTLVALLELESITKRDIQIDTEEKLRQSEERFRTQYKNFPVPTYSWKKDGDDFILVDFNDAAEVITQGKTRELLGCKARERYQDRLELLTDINTCFQSQTIIKKEMLWEMKTTGETKYFAISYVFVPPDIVMVHTEDITERKLAEATLRRFTDKLTQAQEDERRRISRQLHDDAGQTLAALDVRLQMLERRINKLNLIDKDLSADMSDIRSTLQLVQQGLRRTAHQIHPSILEHFGLVEGLRVHLESVCLNVNLSSSIEVDPDFPRMSLTIETAIYRIIQESITNVVKHAQASAIRLRFRSLDNKIVVEVEDNGVGFNITDIHGHNGLGIISMRERAQMISATLDIRSQPGNGTTITLSLLNCASG
jgi:signal transduction histidine kinase